MIPLPPIEHLTQVVRVNFHCHSSFSDGSLKPEQLAKELALAGVRFAALTDHDCIDGLGAFDQVLAAHGIGFLTGVEITLDDELCSFHLLAYGFDPDNEELLQVLRQRKLERRSGFREDIQRLAGFLKPSKSGKDILSRQMPDIAGIIETIHRSGGTAFWAHPWTTCPDPGCLEDWLAKLKALKLDGLEAFCSDSSDTSQELLRAARRHDLLVCAGTDFHGYDQPGLNQIYQDMPFEYWVRFRKAHKLPVPGGTGAKEEAVAPAQAPLLLRKRMIRPKNPKLQWRRFTLRIVLPTLLAVGLSIATIFGLILPSLEKNLMDRKREMIRELIYSTMSILGHYEADTRAGLITRPEAQKRAISHIQFLRYGSERKDYFWVTDMHPRMIMHPYRTDLNGMDLSDLRDVRGTRLFVEFVRVAQARNEGFVEYYWQWKDNPDRVAPKQSFVKRFEPWDWVVGTGIYLDDVSQEIKSMTRRLVHLCLGMTVLIVLLLAYITRESLAIEKRRSKSEAELKDSHEKYAALVEATMEGTLMVLDGRCAYSNPTMAETLGYTEEELSQLDFRLLFPPEADPFGSAITTIHSTLAGRQSSVQFEGDLLRKDGERFRGLCSLTKIAFGGKTGFILVVRDIGHSRDLEEELSRSRVRFQALAEKIDIGVFKISGGREPAFLEMNGAARRVFGFSERDNLTGRLFLDALSDERERSQFELLIANGERVQNKTIGVVKKGGGLSFVTISLVPAREDSGPATFYDGIVEDKTLQKRSEAERDALLGELQSELLFMNEPLKSFSNELALCDMSTPIRRAAEIMSANNAGILGITAGEGKSVIGTVSDCDLRDRVLAAAADGIRPVYDVMTAPVVTLPEDAAVFEAFLEMERKRVHQVALRDTGGQISRMVESYDLVRLHRYTAAVVTSEIQKAKTIAAIVQARARLPWLVHMLLKCGARPRIVCRIMTRISDLIAERVISMAMEKAGPPPAPFCFVALGSEGRGEQTLVTDQDNALIYDSSDSSGKSSEPYFLNLAETVNDALNQTGYSFCLGNIMARNQKWNRPLQEWKYYFRDWITEANPQTLLEFNIFFDFRRIWGDWELARDLRDFIQTLIGEHPSFLLHLAQNALLYKPPVGFFGKIVAESGGESPNMLNLKEAMLPIVNFARLYSLRHRQTETNTLDRLQMLFEKQIIKKAFYEEIEYAYSFLMELRLRNQATALAEMGKPDNLLALRALTPVQETVLKESFSSISTIRKKISFDFLGQA
jgi:PAS domain S-box-containing protein